MRWLRRVAGGLLAILLVVDALLIYEFCRYGPPMVVTEGRTTRAGEAVFKVTRMPVSNQDWAALACLLLLHALLIYVVWRFRTKSFCDSRLRPSK